MNVALVAEMVTKPRSSSALLCGMVFASPAPNHRKNLVFNQYAELPNSTVFITYAHWAVGFSLVWPAVLPAAIYRRP